MMGAKEILEKRMKMSPEEIIEAEKKVWTRSAPADLYYQRDPNRPFLTRATQKLTDLCDRFEQRCILPAEEAKVSNNYQRPKVLRRVNRCSKGGGCGDQTCGAGESESSSNSSSDGSSNSSSDSEDEESAKCKNKKAPMAKDEAMTWIR